MIRGEVTGAGSLIEKRDPAQCLRSLDGDCFRERKVLTMCVLSKLASHDRVDIHYADGDVGPT
jgi:hypothetical protein